MATCFHHKSTPLLLLQNLDIQDHVLKDVVLVLLGDEDFRVRHAAATSLCGYVSLHSQSL